MSDPMTENDLAAIEDRVACRYVFRDDATGEMWIDGGALQRVDVEALLAEVRRLRAEFQGMVAESSWDELATELTEVEADNARLRTDRTAMLDALEAAEIVVIDAQNAGNGDDPNIAELAYCLDRIHDLIGDDDE